MGVVGLDLVDSRAELGRGLLRFGLALGVPGCVDLGASIGAGGCLGSWHLLGRKFGCGADLPRRLSFGCRPGSGSGDVDEVEVVEDVKGNVRHLERAGSSKLWCR